MMIFPEGPEMDLVPKTLNVNVKRLSDTAILPTYGSEKAAGMDLYADITEDFFNENQKNENFYFVLDENHVHGIVIKPNSTAMIPTGLSLEIPEGFFGGVYARSGLASKQGLRPANCVGVVDCDYRGQIYVALHNDSNFERKIMSGQRIAQLILQPYFNVQLTEVDTLSSTDRGEGGFGSSGN